MECVNSVDIMRRFNIKFHAKFRASRSRETPQMRLLREYVLVSRVLWQSLLKNNIFFIYFFITSRREWWQVSRLLWQLFKLNFTSTYIFNLLIISNSPEACQMKVFFFFFLKSFWADALKTFPSPDAHACRHELSQVRSPGKIFFLLCLFGIHEHSLPTFWRLAFSVWIKRQGWLFAALSSRFLPCRCSERQPRRTAHFFCKAFFCLLVRKTAVIG